MPPVDPPPLISIVIPSYRCAATLVQDVHGLEAVLQRCAPRYELLVILDGDGDSGATRAAADMIRSDHVSVWEHAENRGKGFAVISGMLRARGDLVGFMDAGGDIDPHCWETMLETQRRVDADIVIGSKRHPASRVRYPALRRLYSVGYQALTTALFRLPARDTQTGVKLFRAVIIRTVAPRLLVKRFAFDVELLVVARYLGFRRMYEVPVSITYNFSSTVDIREVLRMVWDSVAVFCRLHILHAYDGPAAAMQPPPDTLVRRLQ